MVSLRKLEDVEAYFATGAGSLAFSAPPSSPSAPAPVVAPVPLPEPAPWLPPPSSAPVAPVPSPSAGGYESFESIPVPLRRYATFLAGQGWTVVMPPSPPVPAPAPSATATPPSSRVERVDTLIADAGAVPSSYPVDQAEGPMAIETQGAGVVPLLARQLVKSTAFKAGAGAVGLGGASVGAQAIVDRVAPPESSAGEAFVAGVEGGEFSVSPFASGDANLFRSGGLTGAIDRLPPAEPSRTGFLPEKFHLGQDLKRLTEAPLQTLGSGAATIGAFGAGFLAGSYGTVTTETAKGAVSALKPPRRARPATPSASRVDRIDALFALDGVAQQGGTDEQAEPEGPEFIADPGSQAHYGGDETEAEDGTTAPLDGVHGVFTLGAPLELSGLAPAPVGVAEFGGQDVFVHGGGEPYGVAPAFQVQGVSHMASMLGGSWSDPIQGIVEQAVNFVEEHPVATALGATAVAGAVVSTGYALATMDDGFNGASPRRSTSRRRSSSKRSSRRKPKARKLKRRKAGKARVSRKKRAKKGRRHSHAREDRSGRVVTKKTYRGKKVFWTKKGQPYVKQANGKARFIPK